MDLSCQDKPTDLVHPHFCWSNHHLCIYFCWDMISISVLFFIYIPISLGLKLESIPLICWLETRNAEIMPTSLARVALTNPQKNKKYQKPLYHLKMSISYGC